MIINGRQKSIILVLHILICKINCPYISNCEKPHKMLSYFTLFWAQNIIKWWHRALISLVKITQLIKNHKAWHQMSKQEMWSIMIWKHCFANFRKSYSECGKILANSSPDISGILSITACDIDFRWAWNFNAAFFSMKISLIDHKRTHF